MSSDISTESPVRVVDTAGASRRTNLPKSTLQYYRATNQGPPCYKLGQRVFYDLDELDAWIAARKAQTLRGDQL